MVTTTWTQTAGMSGDTDTDNIENYAEQAEASKDAAAASEAAAAASATAAAASETDAESAEVNASASETAAAASATSASSSATAASNSASSASTSATAAASSASAASASETAAAASETAAATSESNASTSETNAATSASNASTSETNAATSATNASTSETNAAASETAAAASETAAQTAQAAAEAAEAATEALFDQFGDQYLGPKASDPTVDNDGNPLAEGAVYFNTTDDVLKFYSGSAWVAPESVATTAAAAAQAAQASAETAETNAETAETNAAASASSASSSASSASTSADEAAASAASINPDNIDINGGTVDGTVIGGSVPAAGSFTTGSFTGDVAHGDGVKATFGASSDLRIYHNGSNSYIDDTGVGSLFIRSNELRINKYTGEFMLRAAADGPVELYYDNSKKLETTSSGINVSGTAVADGLTVDGDIRINTTSGKLTYVNDTAGWTVDMEDGTSDLYIRSGVASPTDRLKIDGSGDLSLYDSTGTTPKFFWDASNESLGIGMSSPSITFAVDSTKPFRISASVPNITFVETDASNQNWSTGSYGGTFAVRDITGSGYPLQIEAGTANNTLYLDSNNRVGIGTSSPNSLLYLYGAPEATSGAVATIRDSSATSSNTSFGSLVFSSSPGTDYAIGKSNVNAASTLSFRNANTGSSYVDIDSAGNLEMTGGGSVGWANFTFKEESGYLYVYNGPTKIMRVDASGNAAFAGDVEANATL